MLDPLKHNGLTKEQKKTAILIYLESVPMYKFAAASVLISPETLEEWRRLDPKFDAQCEQARSRFVNKTLRKTKPEFQLERAMRNDFSQRTELTGKDGKDLPAPILGSITNGKPN